MITKKLLRVAFGSVLALVTWNPAAWATTNGFNHTVSVEIQPVPTTGFYPITPYGAQADDSVTFDRQSGLNSTLVIAEGGNVVATPAAPIVSSPKNLGQTPNTPSQNNGGQSRSGPSISPQKDTCQGDSGGPLLVNSNGASPSPSITSFGADCANPNLPGK